ncbi:DNA methylase [Mycobacteroides abscessus subsp. abscessus]|uniref:methyltransferase domain-containing protein n=1 Tax=Mycobacteroides abscessus TaxID=36809 RepID=UPI00092997CE|nr:methyltransferase domain-containing protein [Mycobacteroides abscessus]SHU73169.1 DNA methylase [Mycobacteroides abscessus subsp. abscessus]
MSLANIRKAIEAARTLHELAGAAPDPSQRASLNAFPGWGAITEIFAAEPRPAVADLVDELESLTRDGDLAAAARVVDTSFYTPAALITHMYAVLRAAGVRDGNLLDLGCGTGRFIEHAPSGVAGSFTGVEADPFAARICAALHPQANIIAGELETASLPGRRFDAAIGNVPFSSANLYDSVIGFSGPLHQYFLARAVAAVRPGGYVVAVASRHCMDGNHGLPSTVLRDADLIGAVRLPTRYFAASGTDVVADVLILRVRDDVDQHTDNDDEEGQQTERLGWRPAEGRPGEEMLRAIIDGRSACVRVSGFWRDHPECVAGTMRLTGFYQNPLAVDTAKPASAVTAAFKAVGPLLVPVPTAGGPHMAFGDIALTDDQGRKEGSLHIIDGAVMRVEDGHLVPVKRAGNELFALIELRDLTVELVTAEADWDCTDASLGPLRTRCRQAYENYVHTYGPLNRGQLIEGPADEETGMPKLRWRTPTLGGFRSDPDSALVLAIEHFDQNNGQAGPGPILQRRVNRRPVPITRADTPGEALAVSLGEGRGLDLTRIAGLLDLADTDAAIAALGDLVFRDPNGGRQVTARDYLSGNVRAKLRDALEAAATDRQYERNVAALQQVQPDRLTHHDIRIELGSPWVLPNDIADFCEEVFGGRPTVTHVGPLAEWEVDGYRLSDEAKIAYCTTRKDAYQLLQAGLNGAMPKVYDEVYDERTKKWRTERNLDETEAAEHKLGAIAERFSLWVWESPQRQQRIVDLYNETMNSHVLREHDGSYLKFPGMADGIEMWPWQRDYIDRALSTPGAFAGHEMGLGKTKTAVALSITLRQFGVANKPLYCVPNHLIEAATRTCLQDWPSGKFLVVTREDLHGQARRKFIARCALGDWDLVLMTHDTFSRIPVPAHVERDWLQDQLGDLEDYLRYESKAPSKQIARAVRSLKGRIGKLRSGTNDPSTLTWDLLGIDYLVVDEADRFRRLNIATRAEGFSLGASKRAMDLYLKISMLRRANPSRPYASLLTGTPFSNTLAEAFVWQKMLAPRDLDAAGLGHFDAWAAQFVRYETIIETSPDGSGFRSKRRPAIIQNVPELRTMLGRFMSMVRGDQLDLARPTAQRHTVVVQPTAETRDFMDTLVDRSDALRTRRIQPGNDNMLVICGDGRKVALDPNLVGIDGPAPKLDAVAETVAAIYHRTKDAEYSGSDIRGAFQLVLCDLGTPKDGDTQTYGRMRTQMIARGVPAGKIRFIHEATDPKSAEALFAQCRSGEVSVLLGSTAKVGIGTNVQDRLHSLLHVDPTWTAAAWEQRNFRAIRHGNQHESVDVYSFVTQGTFDAFMFGLVERKSRGFEQLYRSDSLVREIEDFGDATLSFAELKAAASGNDLLLRQHELNTRIRKLRLGHVTVMRNVRALMDQADRDEDAAAKLSHRGDRLAEFAAQIAKPGGCFPVAKAAAEVTNPNNWSGWRHEQIRVRIIDLSPGHQLRVDMRHLPIWSETVPPKVWRRGAKAIRRWTHTQLQDWIEALDAEILATRSRAQEATRCAAHARSTAASVDTSEPAELITARQELAEVNKAISDEMGEAA